MTYLCPIRIPRCIHYPFLLPENRRVRAKSLNRELIWSAKDEHSLKVCDDKAVSRMELDSNQILEIRNLVVA